MRPPETGYASWTRLVSFASHNSQASWLGSRSARKSLDRFGPHEPTTFVQIAGVQRPLFDCAHINNPTLACRKISRFPPILLDYTGVHFMRAPIGWINVRGRFYPSRTGVLGGRIIDFLGRIPLFEIPDVRKARYEYLMLSCPPTIFRFHSRRARQPSKTPTSRPIRPRSFCLISRALEWDLRIISQWGCCKES